MGLTAVRGRGGHSVLGFWQAHAPRQPLVAHGREGSLTADLFVLAVNAFCHSLSGPTVLVLANASIHKAHVVRACEAGGAAAGLTRFFLPAYSPELNHIEFWAPLQALLDLPPGLRHGADLTTTPRTRAGKRR